MDALYLVLVIALFAVGIAYVSGCGKLLGGGDE
jgi:hypothetical protein